IYTLSLHDALPILMTTVMVYAQSEEKQYSNQELTKLAKEIQDQVITIDTHCDFDLNNFTSQVNYSQNTDSQVNLPKMRKGGLDVAWLIVYTGQEELSAKGFKKAHKN